MTQGPPAYGAPSGYPPGHPAPVTRRRPSAWWFGVGIALLVGAAAAGVGLFWWTLSAFLDTDATIDADGRPHPVSVDTDGDRMLWLEDGFGQDCEVVDRATGDPITLRPVSGSLERSDGSGSWRGSGRFDPGSGRLEITCTGSEGAVIVGAAPRVGSFVGGILATVLVPLTLGLAGTAVLIVTGVLWTSRPARPQR